MNVDMKVDDIITTKKNHPCGGNTWRVIRVGADVKIECTTCSRAVMLPRDKLIKNIALINGEKPN